MNTNRYTCSDIDKSIKVKSKKYVSIHDEYKKIIKRDIKMNHSRKEV